MARFAAVHQPAQCVRALLTVCLSLRLHLSHPSPPCLCVCRTGQFIVDTGTSIICGPNNRVGPLIDAVNKSTGYAIAADGTMACDLEAKVPTLGFVIDVR